jgi:hypothetical protein
VIHALHDALPSIIAGAVLLLLTTVVRQLSRINGTLRLLLGLPARVERLEGRVDVLEEAIS